MMNSVPLTYISLSFPKFILLFPYSSFFLHYLLCCSSLESLPGREDVLDRYRMGDDEEEGEDVEGDNDDQSTIYSLTSFP